MLYTFLNTRFNLHAAVQGVVVPLQLVDALQLAQLLHDGVDEVVVVLLGVVAAGDFPSAAITVIFVIHFKKMLCIVKNGLSSFYNWILGVSS